LQGFGSYSTALLPLLLLLLLLNPAAADANADSLFITMRRGYTYLLAAAAAG
jgi:hypothetical protein